jgi:hypothetical protein
VSLQITGGACEVIQLVDFAPCVTLSKSSAHGERLSPKAASRDAAWRLRVALADKVGDPDLSDGETCQVRVAGLGRVRGLLPQARVL